MNRGWDLCCTFIQLYDSPMDKIDDLGLRVGKEDDNRDAHTIRFNYCTATQYPQPQTYGRSLNKLKVFFAYDNIIFPC